jgi:hypothetical protein
MKFLNTEDALQQLASSSLFPISLIAQDLSAFYRAFCQFLPIRAYYVASHHAQFRLDD